MANGVVLTASGDVDTVAPPVARRSAIVAARRRFPVIANERAAYEGRRGRHRDCGWRRPWLTDSSWLGATWWSSWVGTRLRSARG